MIRALIPSTLPHLKKFEVLVKLQVLPILWMALVLQRTWSSAEAWAKANAMIAQSSPVQTMPTRGRKLVLPCAGGCEPLQKIYIHICAHTCIYVYTHNQLYIHHIYTNMCVSTSACYMYMHSYIEAYLSMVNAFAYIYIHPLYTLCNSPFNF